MFNSRTLHNAFWITAKLSVAVWLLGTPEAVIAQQMSSIVSVSVSYEVKMKKPEDESQLDETMRKAREMVYLRVKEECVDMKKHVASSCALSSLDIQQNTARARRSNRNGQGETITIRARAKYKIELIDAMK